MAIDMTNPPEKIALREVGRLLRSHLATEPELITIIKVHRDAKYHFMVDIMDELALSNIERFSLAPMTPRDIQAVEGLAPGASL